MKECETMAATPSSGPVKPEPGFASYHLEGADLVRDVTTKPMGSQIPGGNFGARCNLHDKTPAEEQAARDGA